MYDAKIDLSDMKVKHESGLTRQLAIAVTATDTVRLVEIVEHIGRYTIVTKPLADFPVPFPRDCIVQVSRELAELAEALLAGDTVTIEDFNMAREAVR